MLDTAAGKIYTCEAFYITILSFYQYSAILFCFFFNFYLFYFIFVFHYYSFNPLNPELNPICYLLALLAHYFLHVSRIRVKSLTLRLLMSYIYGALILDVSRSHTTTQHSR